MKTITILILLIPLLNFAQDDVSSEFWLEEFTAKRVFINKTVTSFNFNIEKYQNNKVVSKKEYVNFDEPEPSKITISSDESKASIQISSRYYKEDLYFEFKRIYKSEFSDGSPYYQFVGKSSCSAYYYFPEDNSNQSLSIQCLDNDKNGTRIYFVMSQNHQL